MGVCSDSVTFSVWFDNTVLPAVNWQLSTDNAIRGGLSGPMRTSRPVLRVVGAALMLCIHRTRTHNTHAQTHATKNISMCGIYAVHTHNKHTQYNTIQNKIRQRNNNNNAHKARR